MQILISGWLLPIIYLIGWLLVYALPGHHWSIARQTALIGLLATVASVVAATAGSLIAGAGIDRLGLVAALLVSLATACKAALSVPCCLR